MRKPRNYDAELKALNERAAQLRGRKLQRLGELVIATGADALPIELLAGALLAVAAEKDISVREDWSKTGAAFFQNRRLASRRAGHDAPPAAQGSGGTLPFDGDQGAQ